MDIRTSGLADRGGGSHLQEEGPEGVLSNIPLYIVLTQQAYEHTVSSLVQNSVVFKGDSCSVFLLRP